MYQHLAPCLLLSPIGNYTVYGFIILRIRLKYNARQRFILECYSVMSSRYFTTTFLPLTM